MCSAAMTSALLEDTGNGLFALINSLINQNIYIKGTEPATLLVTLPSATNVEMQQKMNWAAM